MSAELTVSHDKPTENPPSDNRPDLPPDVARIVAAWPTLPEAIRAGILAMVAAAGEAGKE